MLTKCMLNCQVDKLNFQLNLWQASAEKEAAEVKGGRKRNSSLQLNMCMC